MTTQRMTFARPIFHSGLNVTVRNGTRWGNLAQGDLIELVDLEGKVIMTAVVSMVDVINYRHDQNFLTRMMKWAHDPECQTLDGINDMMTRSYGAGQWGPIVTLVAFMVTSKIPLGYSSDELLYKKTEHKMEDLLPNEEVIPGGIFDVEAFRKAKEEGRFVETDEPETDVGHTAEDTGHTAEPTS